MTTPYKIENLDIHQLIVCHLKCDCKQWDGMCNYSLYGDDGPEFGDGSFNVEKFKEELIEYNNKKVMLNDNSDNNLNNREYIINHEFISTNYCANSTMLSRSFCNPCQTNFKKIAYYLNQKNGLQYLAYHWDSYFDENTVLNTLKNIQTREQFKECNPNFLVNPLWKIKIFDNYIDDDIKLSELEGYDVIKFSWHFTKDISLLLKLPNLKGIIFGHWFQGDLNVLHSHPSLEFIQVRPSYNNYLVEKIYNITYYTKENYMNNFI